jgi:5-methylcytosine-specific restriction endonuclease McrA
MRKTTRKGWVRKLDKLVKEIVIARDGMCIVCGTTSNLTPGHLFSRVAYSTRWDLDNVYAQCLNCNFRHESDPYPMTEAVKKIFSSDIVDIIHRKYVTPHKYKTYELEELYNDLSKRLGTLKDLHIRVADIEMQTV